MVGIDINKLRIRNKVFGYGISEQDILSLTNLGEELKKYEPGDKIIARYKSWIVSVQDNYYDGLRVEIEKYTGTAMQKYNAVFAMENEVFFKFIPTYEQFKMIEKLMSLRENIKKHRYYHSEKHAVIDAPGDILEYKKDMFFENELNEELLVGESVIKTICEIYDKDYKQVEERMSKKVQDKMNRIIMVIERKNKRLYAYKTAGKRTSKGGTAFTVDGSVLPQQSGVLLATIDFDETDYNYIDEDREFYQEWGKKLYLFDDMKAEEYDVEMLRRIRDEDGVVIINKTQYLSYGKRLKLYDLQDKRTKDIKVTYKKELEKRLTSIKQKEFTHNDITFSKEGIEFAGLKLSLLKKNGKSGNWNSKFVGTLNLEESTDFNDLFTRFVSGIAGGVTHTKPVIDETLTSVETIMGKVNVKYEKKDVLSYVNDKRINQNDVIDVMMRALCFDTTEHYNQFLTDVSKVSLKYHTGLSNGLIILFQKGFDTVSRRRTGGVMDDSYIMRLQMKRKSNAYYIVYEDKEFKIKNSNRMLNLTNKKHRGALLSFEEVWTVINDCLPDASEVDKMAIIKEGLKEHKKAEERAEKLFQKTLKNLKVKEGSMTIEGKQEMKGYIVPGKMRKYFLTKELKVFDYKTKKYFCIVDTQYSKRVKKDQLVNRMLALANDQHLVKAIYTLK